MMRAQKSQKSVDVFCVIGVRKPASQSARTRVESSRVESSRIESIVGLSCWFGHFGAFSRCQVSAQKSRKASWIRVQLCERCQSRQSLESFESLESLKGIIGRMIEDERRTDRRVIDWSELIDDDSGRLDAPPDAHRVGRALASVSSSIFAAHSFGLQRERANGKAGEFGNSATRDAEPECSGQPNAHVESEQRAR